MNTVYFVGKFLLSNLYFISHKCTSPEICASNSGTITKISGLATSE